jgi:hypothetical protein
MTSPAAGSVPVRDEGLSYASMNLVTSPPPETGAPMVPGSGICCFSPAMARAKDSMNCLGSYMMLAEQLAEGTALAEDLAWLECPAQEDPASRLEPAAGADRVSPVGILISTVVAV